MFFISFLFVFLVVEKCRKLKYLEWGWLYMGFSLGEVAGFGVMSRGSVWIFR